MIRKSIAMMALLSLVALSGCIHDWNYPGHTWLQAGLAACLMAGTATALYMHTVSAADDRGMKRRAPLFIFSVALLILSIVGCGMKGLVVIERIVLREESPHPPASQPTTQPTRPVFVEDWQEGLP